MPERKGNGTRSVVDKRAAEILEITGKEKKQGSSKMELNEMENVLT